MEEYLEKHLSALRKQLETKSNIAKQYSDNQKQMEDLQKQQIELTAVFNMINEGTINAEIAEVEALLAKIAADGCDKAEAPEEPVSTDPPKKKK